MKHGKYVHILPTTWYLNLFFIFIKVVFGSNKVSALVNFYLHPLRFVGARFDCKSLNVIIQILAFMTLGILRTQMNLSSKYQQVLDSPGNLSPNFSVLALVQASELCFRHSLDQQSSSRVCQSDRV